MNFTTVANEAHEAGLKAARTAEVELIGIRGATYTFPICGFAWVAFAGNTPWGRWAKAEGIAAKSYPKGLSIWVTDFGQSYDKKRAYARAYADVLNAHGINAHAGSRLD